MEDSYEVALNVTVTRCKENMYSIFIFNMTAPNGKTSNIENSIINSRMTLLHNGNWNGGYVNWPVELLHLKPTPPNRISKFGICGVVKVLLENVFGIDFVNLFEEHIRVEKLFETSISISHSKLLFKFHFGNIWQSEWNNQNIFSLHVNIWKQVFNIQDRSKK